MSQSRTNFLLVDDNAPGRKTIRDLFGQDFGTQICAPESLEKVREAITFELFDGLLIDVELSKFDDIGGKIDGITIDNGVDIVELYLSRLRQTISTGLYTTHGKLPGPYDKKIEELKQTYQSHGNFHFLGKPLPRDMSQLEKLFQPVRQEAEDVHNSNPLFQPLSHYADGLLSKRLRAYKKVCRIHANWLDFKFESVGDCSWGVVCGRAAERRYYGKPLVDNSVSQFAIQIRDDYPTKAELQGLAEAKDALPFVVWNTRKLDFIEKQFQYAGPRLDKIPDYLQHYFGIAMASACVKAYEEGRKDRVIEWCQQLTIPAQVEIAKQIYKKLYHTPALENFLNECREANLPLIVEIFDSKVDSIKQEEEPVAWVELRNLGSTRAVSMEPFDFAQLQKSGVDHETQRFDYIVYELPGDDVAMSIEPL